MSHSLRSLANHAKSRLNQCGARFARPITAPAGLVYIIAESAGLSLASRPAGAVMIFTRPAGAVMIFTRPAGAVMIFTKPAVMIFTRSRNAATGDNSMYCMIPDPFPSSAFGKVSATPYYCEVVYQGNSVLVKGRSLQ